MSEQQPARGGVGSVDRALSLLGAFTIADSTLTLSELASRTRQYKSTVLRLLASLEHAHLVRRLANGRFMLGGGVARLHAVYAASFSIGDLVMPALHDLVRKTGESASFHVEQAEQDLCLCRVDSPHPVRDHMRAGDVRPMKGGVAGQMLLAYRGRGGPRAARLRDRPLLVANGDLVPELGAIAAAVFGADQQLAGVLVLTMPTMRWDPRHVAAVQDAAHGITAALSGAAPPSGIRANPR